MAARQREGPSRGGVIPRRCRLLCGTVQCTRADMVGKTVLGGRCESPQSSPVDFGGHDDTCELGKNTSDLHKVTLEELLQLPLSCRVGQVADVETASLSSAGEDGIVVGGRLIGGLIGDRGIAQSVGNVIDGFGNLLDGSRHFVGIWLDEKEVWCGLWAACRMKCEITDDVRTNFGTW